VQHAGFVGGTYMNIKTVDKKVFMGYEDEWM
jgi:hypothetical protein